MSFKQAQIFKLFIRLSLDFHCKFSFEGHLSSTPAFIFMVYRIHLHRSRHEHSEVYEADRGLLGDCCHVENILSSQVRIACSCGSPSIYTCISINPCFTVPNKNVIEVYLPSIHSSSKGTAVKNHQIIKGDSFWANQHTPQLNLVHNQEDPVKKEHAATQSEKKETIQSNQDEVEPEVPDDTPMDPLKIVHLDLKGAAPKVKYLEQVGMCVNRIVFQTCGILY